MKYYRIRSIDGVDWLFVDENGLKDHLSYYDTNSFRKQYGRLEKYLEECREAREWSYNNWILGRRNEEVRHARELIHQLTPMMNNLWRYEKELASKGISFRKDDVLSAIWDVYNRDDIEWYFVQQES